MSLLKKLILRISKRIANNLNSCSYNLNKFFRYRFEEDESDDDEEGGDDEEAGVITTKGDMYRYQQDMKKYCYCKTYIKNFLHTLREIFRVFALGVIKALPNKS